MVGRPELRGELMVNVKHIMANFNRDLFLLLALFGLVVVTTSFKFNFIFGITLTFSSIFLFLILRIFGLKASIVIGVLMLFIVPYEHSYLSVSVVTLIEVIYVGLFFMNGRKAKMFFVDAIFWFLIGGFALFFIYKNSLSGDALYFEICKHIINSLVNVLIADMLLAYFPFYKFLKKNRVNKNHVSIHQFLSHITLFSILVPFYITITTNTLNIYESISKDLESKARISVERIERELQSLGQVELANGNVLTKIIKQNDTDEFDIVLENSEGILAASTAGSPNGISQLYQNYQIKKVSGQLYESLPIDGRDIHPINQWAQGQYSYIEHNNDFTILLHYPIANYQNQIFKVSVDQLRYILIIILPMVLLLLIVNRMLMNNLKTLTIVTTGLPKKLRNQGIIEWPQSTIYELQVLGKNLRKMADKITELFQESTEMNQLLSEQTEKLKASEEQLHCLAFYDGLTTLPNRHFFYKYVNDLIELKAISKLAIIFLDLNQFKQVNDTLGHDAGDQLLQQAANRLMTLKSEKREVFRLGGDEFVVVSHIEQRDEAEGTVSSIIQLFSNRFEIQGYTLYITASIGVSVYPEDGQDLNTLVKFADIAMYTSKEKGGNMVQYFDQSMKDKFQEKMLIENALRLTVEKGGFELYYQPKTFLGHIKSMEALLRWADPGLGIVSPAVFIPIAEEMGLIAQIDQWSLREACRQNKQWQDEESLFVPISVNLSAKHFQQEYLVPMVREALEESGLEAKYLKLEITESVFIKDHQRVVTIINNLKEIGVRISIDDFGKGYSSLYQLLNLPIDEIKIDRQFIQDIHENDKQALLVKSMLDMAHGLNLNVVAEGVETSCENEYLLEMGCDEIQGYLFSPPVNKEQMLMLLRDKELHHI